MSSFDDLFENLLRDKQIEVLMDYSASESLRVSLVRRWNKYKEKMDSLGFLEDGLRNLSLSREPYDVMDGDVKRSYTRFLLKPKAIRKTYQILMPTNNSSTEESK